MLQMSGLEFIKNKRMGNNNYIIKVISSNIINSILIDQNNNFK
jgi:hypothetical protein